VLDEPVYNEPEMGEDGRFRGEVLSRCPKCGNPYDPEDNFCRRCGTGLQSTRVPAVRDDKSYAVAPWRDTLPVAVRGAAVVAAGTVAEALLRRVIGRVLRGPRPSTAKADDKGRQKRLPVRREPEKADVVEPSDGQDGDQVVSETIVFRRVRLRRWGWPGD
jgi:hypothetical protein